MIRSPLDFGSDWVGEPAPTRADLAMVVDAVWSSRHVRAARAVAGTVVAVGFLCLLAGAMALDAALSGDAEGLPS